MSYALSLEASKRRENVRSIAWVIAGSILLSLAAHIKIPLFFTPIPMVLQNAIAVALGATLGSRRGCAAVLLFLVYGSLGLPVFAGCHGGLSILLSPLSGGYLAGYAAAAFFTGLIREKLPSLLFPTILAGLGLILFLGFSVLSLSLGMSKAWQLGVLPFLGIDLAKAFIVWFALRK